jgi:hypothetical protein
LLNPPTATRCDCGWDFASQALSPSAAHAEAQKYVQYALRSWQFPLMVWASQLIFAVSMMVIPQLAPVGLLLMLGQFVLIVYGLSFGLKALSKGRTSLSLSQRRSAIFGVALSSGTILLIAGFTLYKSF